MQIDVVRDNGRSHKGRYGHPVSAVRNLEAEHAGKHSAPVGLCRKCTDQEDNAHQYDERRQDIFHALVAAGPQQEKRNDPEDQGEYDLGSAVIRSRDRRLNTEDRSGQVSCLISDISDKDSRDDEDRDEDPRTFARKLRAERFSEAHPGDNAEPCCHRLHDDD